MKPLRLNIKAFAAYAGEQVIDFQSLNEHGLFLIHGPTGSGKTTILDAISFALYGECAGDLRQAKEMRSHHVSDDTPTEVTFDFSIGSSIYRATRTLAYERKAQKGKGYTQVKPTAKVWRMENIDGHFREIELLASKLGESTAMIEEIIGFKLAQFKQVIVLPQGRFRELLTSGSTDREAVLEVLFQTEWYGRIEEELKVVKKDLEVDVKGRMEKLSFLLQTHEVSSRDELMERWAEAKESKEIASKARTAAKEADTRAQEILAKGKRTLDIFKELSDAQQALQKISEGKTEWEHNKKVHEKAVLADSLKILEKAVSAQAQEAKSAQTRLESANNMVEQSSRALMESEERLAAISSKAGDMEKSRQQITILDALKGKVAGYEAAVHEFHKTKQIGSRLEKKIGSSKKELELLNETLEKLGNERMDLEKKASAREYAEKAVQESDKLCMQRQKLIDLNNRMSQLQALAKKYEEESVTLEKKIKKLSNNLDELYLKWRAGQAGLLAETLETGKPCPVCGSLEHPALAIKEQDCPSDEYLEQANEALDQAMGEKLRLNEKISPIDRELSELKGKTKTIEEDLGHWASAPLDELDKETRKRAKALKEAEKASKRVISVDKEMENLKESTKIKSEQFQDTQAKYNNAIAETKGLEATVKEKESDLPEELRSEAVLNGKIAQETKKLASMEKELEEARNAVTKSREDLSTYRAKAEGATQDLSRSKAQLEENEREFKNELLEAGFKDMEEYYENKLSKEEIKELAAEIQEFQSRLMSSTQRAERAKEQSKGLEKPDLKTMETNSLEVKEALEKAIQADSEAAKALKDLERAAGDYRKLSSEMSDLENKYQVVGRIADLVNGNNPERMTLHRFVLASLLEDVAMAATQRLKVMSSGRYSLQRVTRLLDKRTAGGLDFEIHDEYTGMARPARSLSGGETFLASLSLALGLADVTSSYSGGIQLDTVFIDEGFGTLDPEALDLAIKALSDLRASGRIVGIISHVPELLERIPAAIEVKTSRKGGKAEIRTPA